MRKYVSNTVCYLLTDSRVAYYLFHQKIGDSVVKIRRWVLKLIADYPQVRLVFIRTTDNLADYLTRMGLPKGDAAKLCLKNLSISNFSDKLPKQEFTLQEWDNFVKENPQYLTVTANETHAVAYALTQGINNLRDTLDPIAILQEKLSRENIILAQKEEFPEIFEGCFESVNFSMEKEGKKKEKLTFKIQSDLILMKTEEKDFKILLPNKLIGPLLAYLHLIGHMGTNKMIENMKSYTFKNKYTCVRNFVGICYGCFLTHRSSRKNILGTYPVPNHPFEEVSMDLAENLNEVKSYKNLLIVQDVLTDFLLIFPMKTKNSRELINIFMYSIFQNFNVKRVHSDNGPAFRNKDWLKLMAALNIKIINSSANNPQARGKAERAVQLVKTTLKKILATASSGTLNWEYLPIIVSKVVNQSITPRTGFRPVEMIFGKGPLADSFLDLPPLFPTHHLVKDKKREIEILTSDIMEMSKVAKQSLEEISKNSKREINKNRTDKSEKFQKGDIVYALDRYNLQGNSRPLKTTFFPSPFVIIETFYTTCLIERLADKFRTLISNNDIKKFKNNSEIVKNLPNEIQKTLLGDFKDIIEDDIAEIAKIDPMSVPPGIFLKNNSDFDNKNKKLENLDEAEQVGNDEDEEEFIEEELMEDDGDEEEPSNNKNKYNLRSKKVKFKE